LRDQILPQTIGRVPGISYAVTGSTAINYDWASTLHARTGIVVAVVAGLAFLLLMLAFRSIPLPLVSIALNLLSVGAAYGIVTLIFQDGWLHGLIGFTPSGTIAQWVPLFTFVFLFGLSTDYHVFILSRVRERYAQGMTTADALTSGIASSAGVVTSAAVIMVAVFSIFATLSFVDIKTLGVGLAVAVLVDATAVRGILVPAAIALLRERTWYMPRVALAAPRQIAGAAAQAQGPARRRSGGPPPQTDPHP
jgi:RND superfamily putative drug exporter